MGKGGSLYAEVELCEALGLPRDVMRGVRLQLSHGRDWGYHDGAVVFDQEGVEVALAMLEIPEKDRDDIMALGRIEKGRARDAKAKEALLEVAAETRGVRNRVILLARFTDEKDRPNSKIVTDERGLVRVRVANNENFLPGMTIPARWVEQDLWEYVGRLPRTRGRM